MLLAFEDWQEDFESAILDRGWGYYEEGRVVSLKWMGDKVSAVVQGTTDYDVEITFDGDTIIDLDCDCPYAVDGSLCKHMAAVLYALEDEPLRLRPKKIGQRFWRRSRQRSCARFFCTFCKMTAPYRIKSGCIWRPRPLRRWSFARNNSCRIS